MDVIKCNKLDEKYQSDVRELVQECLKVDGLERTLYLSNENNYIYELDCFFLLYFNNKLVSVLTIDQPTEKEAEISAYTLPQERHKGYFKLLLNLAKEELEQYQINDIYIVNEPSSKDGLQTINHIGAIYRKSEYLLCLDINLTNESRQNYKFIENSSIQTKNTNESDLNKIAKICANIFHTTVDEEYDLLNYVIESNDCFSISVYNHNEFIGICNMNVQDNNAFIFGFGIVPKYQGKGYGKLALTIIINELKEKGFKYITLHVGSDNKKAFSLYIKSGFQIKTQYDYYILDER